ncbi:hypothetical protein, partial [Corynebacterium sp. HMSC074A09]|uniref:hypothetical protein n=2 Tax=unclassified Corynebacterium TaxID=2624378 RepID=UPI001E49E2EC
MQQDDFFEWIDVFDGLVERQVQRINRKLLEEVRNGTSSRADLEVVVPLTQIVRDEFTGSSGFGVRSGV